MRRAHEDVTEFHRLVGATVGDVAKPDATVDMKLRVKLMAEEFDELLEALAPGVRSQISVRDAVNAWLLAGHVSPFTPKPNLPEVADALADLEYVTIGSAVAWGIPGAAVWSEVNAANMRKQGGPKDANGKALKPPGWKGPDVEGVLQREAEAQSRRRPHRRGDQVTRLADHWDDSFVRWVLDEKAEGNAWTWWAYSLHYSGSIGKRDLVDISLRPTILEPWDCDPLPEVK